MKKRNYFIFGSFGFGNLGDECIPHSIESLLHEIDEVGDVKVISRYNRPSDPSTLGLESPDLDKIEITDEDRVIIAGGGIIEPRTMSCLSRHQKLPDNFKALNTSMFGVSVEFGVNYNILQKRRVIKHTGQFEKIYTRDYFSEFFLHQMSKKISIETIGDLVLSMKGDRPDTKNDVSNKQNKYILVCLSQSWSKDPGWLDWVATELCTLSRELNCQVHFYPMSTISDDDRKTHLEVSNRMLENSVIYEPILHEGGDSPKKAANIYAKAELVVSMRLHGCVLSYAQKTPFVGLSYHPKLIGFGATIGWREFILPPSKGLDQDSNRYGIRFQHEDFPKGLLVDSAISALEYANFDLLPVFKQKQRSTLAKLLSES